MANEFLKVERFAAGQELLRRRKYGFSSGRRAAVVAGHYIVMDGPVFVFLCSRFFAVPVFVLVRGCNRLISFLLSYLSTLRTDQAAWDELFKIQGGPSALGKRYVDSKFEVAFSS